MVCKFKLIGTNIFKLTIEVHSDNTNSKIITLKQATISNKKFVITTKLLWT